MYKDCVTATLAAVHAAQILSAQITIPHPQNSIPSCTFSLLKERLSFTVISKLATNQFVLQTISLLLIIPVFWPCGGEWG